MRNNTFDSVVTTGAAVGADTQTTGLQRDVVKHDEDSGRGDLEVAAQLQHRFSRQIHIGLGLQQEEFLAFVGGLAVQTLIFQLVDLAAQAVREDINGAEAGVMPGLLIFPSGIAQTDDEPVFA